MHPNTVTIRRFYDAFAAGDHETMAAAYADTAVFSDPVFPALDAAGVRAMWRMFCTGGNAIEVTYGDVTADDHTGSARWEAVYTFPKTGRRVHNRIEASFRFDGVHIVEHRDHFNFWRWSRQALGPAGLLLGWTPVVRRQVQAQAGAQLRRFQAGER